MRFLGVPLDRVDVAPNGPGIAEDAVGPPPDEIRRRFGVGGAPLLLTVAPNLPHKNVPRLAVALAQIPDAVLVLPGYGTGRDEELEALAEREGVAERLRRPGWVDEAVLDGLYRAADCVIAPSLAEGFGLPVLEAMLRGTPVACSNATSLPEVAGDAALLFDPTDVDEIAASVRRILEDRELADRLRAAGPERAGCSAGPSPRGSPSTCYRRALA